MDDQQRATILADLEACCVALARRLQDDFEALSNAPSETTTHGLLGAMYQKVDATGKAAFAPWETTPLRTLALNPAIATPIAKTHGVTMSDVLSIGALSLPDSRHNVFFAGTGASTFFTRMAIQNLASYLVANEGWSEAIAVATAQERKLSQSNAVNEELQTTYRDSNEKREKQDAALAKGRVIANANRTAKTSGKRDTAKTLFSEWRQHRDNLTADHARGYDHVARIFNEWRWTTANGSKFTGNTIKEYFRAPRSRAKRAA